MHTGRVLMIAGQVIALVAVVAQFVIPATIIIAASRRPDYSVAVPLRWFVPLLLMIVAGAVSLIALLRFYR